MKWCHTAVISAPPETKNRNLIVRGRISGNMVV